MDDMKIPLRQRGAACREEKAVAVNGSDRPAFLPVVFSVPSVSPWFK